MEKKYTVTGIGPRIEAFLGTLIRNAGFVFHFDITEGAPIHPDLDDPEVAVKFHGPEVGLLLENRAELLLAIEQLTMEMLALPTEDHSRLYFDANDYRILRMEELRLSAVAAAEGVKRTGKPFHFNPMSSRERRLIHLSLRNETTLRSESTGTGPYRQVVILPVDMPLPEPIRPPAPRADAPRGGGRRPGPPRFSR